MTKIKQTKQSLINQVYDQSSLKLNDVSESVNLFLQAIVESLGRGETVELRGLGTFEVKLRTGRRGLDFKTGEIKKNNDYKAVLFRSGKQLKSLLAEAKNEKSN